MPTISSSERSANSTPPGSFSSPPNTRCKSCFAIGRSVAREGSALLRRPGAGLAGPGRRVARREAVVDRVVDRRLGPGPVGPLVVGVDARAVGLVPGRRLARGVARPRLELVLV